jgi:hypothetical protein
MVQCLHLADRAGEQLLLRLGLAASFALAFAARLLFGLALAQGVAHARQVLQRT